MVCQNTHTTQTRTQSKVKQKKVKSLDAIKDSHTDQMRHWNTWALIRCSAGKSTWRACTPQVGLNHAQDDVVGTQSPTWTHAHTHSRMHTHTQTTQMAQTNKHKAHSSKTTQ